MWESATFQSFSPNRTINHLVDNFDKSVTMIVTEPHLFEDTGLEMMGNASKYQQLAAICQERHVPMVSLGYIEVALTSPVHPCKDQFSVLKSDIIHYHQQLGNCTYIFLG